MGEWRETTRKNPSMPTVFTRIIQGELPGRFVWRDDRCAAFLSINPLKPGHTLVVPIEETDHWIDCPPDLLAHLVSVSQTIGQALDRAYNPPKVALILLGLEVPHLHFHVVPIWSEGDAHFDRADRNPDPAALDEAQDSVLAALRELGHEPLGI
jgi:histidine triad (HIT) family protein